MGRPGQPFLALEEFEHVLGVADVIDRPVPGIILDERLAGGALHREEDGFREHFEPVAGIPARFPGSEVEVGLLAGDQEELVVGESTAFLEHRRHLGEPERARVVGVSVAVELGDVDGVDPEPLEDLDEVGDRRRVDLRGLLLHRLDGERHVPVARKRLVAGKLGEMVVVREPEDFAKGVLGRASAQEVEDPEPLLGPRRGVEPGDVIPPAGLRLADTEAVLGPEPPVVPTVPDGLEVVGPVPREEKLVRGRETGERAAIGLGDDRPVSDRVRDIGTVGRDRLADELPLRIHPRQALANRRITDESRVVGEGPTLLKRRDDRLDMDQARSLRRL